MGCSSSLPKRPDTRGVSDELKKILVGGTGDGGSPPSSIDLATRKDAATINGQLLGELIRAGYVHLYENHGQCNKINVFPVPDGDTGTNMVITLRPAVAGLGTEPSTNINELMTLVAGQTTLNAQGNSGTIFSFVFSKLNVAIQEINPDGVKDEITMEQFSQALAKVGSQMMNAMKKPMPGTLLSVIGDAFDTSKRSANTLDQVIRSAYTNGNESLQKTPDQLIVDGKKVLKNFRGQTVVDSGGQGFIYLLEGMVKALDGTLEYGEYLEAGTAGDADVDEGIMGGDEIKSEHESDIEQMKYVFCTECVAELRSGAKEDDIRAALSAPYTGNDLNPLVANYSGPLGDSLGTLITKLSDNVSLCKVHMHSNDPDEVFRRMNAFTKDGHLFKEKAEDMREQVKLANTPYHFPTMEGKSKVGIIWTSIADVPDGFREKYKDGFVSLVTVIDSGKYKDGQTINALNFANILRRWDYYKIGTSGWNPADVKTAIDTMLSKGYDEILAITLPVKASQGTHNAWNNAVEQLNPEDQKKCTKFAHPGAMEGLVVMRAHYLASQGKMNSKQLIDALTSYIRQNNNNFMAYAFDSILNLRNGGRLDPVDKGIMKMIFDRVQRKGLGIVATSTATELDKKGDIKTKLGFKPYEKILAELPQMIFKMSLKSTAKSYDIMVSHSARPQNAEIVVIGLKKLLPIRNIYYSEITTIGMVHYGPNAILISVWESDDMDFTKSLS